MGKSLFIAEKPSVAQSFAAVLGVTGRNSDGYLESADYVVTWCVGHLVTMSYPEAYDEKYKRWTVETLPFLPSEFRYEVIDGVKKQYNIVSRLLTREDVDTIYVCTDSGREGEYIYRLVAQMAGVGDKCQKRVWIDSQTEEEIRRGIREAKDESEYDNLSASAYLRAKEDYLMGINFSRALTLCYGPVISNYMRTNRTVVSVGRVMTCVLGMVVRREREIREFVKTPFYRVIGTFGPEDAFFDAEWRAVKGSRYEGSPKLYKENGFRDRKTAEELIDFLKTETEGTVVSVSSKKEVKNPPLLYNLAEIQNDCSRIFKMSPDQTLAAIQELYEKKLVTYPRTDARVLSTAVAKEIDKNLQGVARYESMAPLAEKALSMGRWKTIAKTRYVNDKMITDHYAIIPTGQGLAALRSLSDQKRRIYELIVRRFLSIFYPPAVYRRYSVQIDVKGEQFFAGFRVLLEPGYLEAAGMPKKNPGNPGGEKSPENPGGEKNPAGSGGDEEIMNDADNPALQALFSGLKKGQKLPLKDLSIKEGETSPPKRYTSGSMILAMENAGQLIEDEDLRAQIKGSGIGTSATRAEILKKLVTIKYLALNSKTQVITPTFLGELVFEAVGDSMKQLLNPELTASWEKGLSYVAEGSITSGEYMEKLEHFVSVRTNGAIKTSGQNVRLRPRFDKIAPYYKSAGKNRKSSSGPA